MKLLHRNFFLIFFFVLTFLFSSCDDVLTGAVVSDVQVSTTIRCADAVALTVNDYCINEDNAFIMLISNSGYGSIDSMNVLFYFEEDTDVRDNTISRSIPRMGLEPTDSRIFEIPIYDERDIEMIHVQWFFSRIESIRSCREDLTIPANKIRRCEN